MGTQNTKIQKEPENTKVIKEGQIDIQYGYKANIFSRYCVVNATELIIYSDKSLTTWISTVPIISLLNIDVNHTNTEFFQILFKGKGTPIINIHCKSKQEKASWVSVFENICPITLLTQELQIVKNCARNMGYGEEEIEIALIQYHNKYATLYNVNEFIGFILKNRAETDQKTKLEEKRTETEDMSTKCAVCLATYTSPVRNIHDKVYCLECITHWFDIIKEDQTQIRDPYTNKSLPQHCRLLMPHFSLMVQVWNHTHSENEKISEPTHQTLKDMDERLDEQRKKVLNHLLQFEDAECYASKVADAMMKADDLMFDKKSLNEILTPSIEYYQCFITIKKLIQESCSTYNNAIKNIYGNGTSQNHLFKWKEPKWHNFIDKNCIDWAGRYQVDEAHVSYIFDEVHTLMDSVSAILKSEEDNVDVIQQQISELILKQQAKHINAFAVYEEDKKQPPRTENEQFVFCNMERIQYSEKHGLVNTRCMAEIAECMKRNKPFELYHNDIGPKSMNRNELVRFLQTAGMDGITSQYHMYKNLTLILKGKLWKLSNYLKKKQLQKGAEFPYFRYLKHVETIEPQMVQPRDWNPSNDKIALQVTLDLDYDEHLRKYNNKKRELRKVLKKQIMKHLQLECLDKHVQVTNIRKGSIQFKLIIYAPYVSIAGGLVWFGYDIFKYNTDEDYMIPYKNMLIQGAMVGGGIAGVCAQAAFAAGTCSVLWPIGIVVGSIILGAALGYVGWKLLKRRRAARARENPPNPRDGNQGKQRDVILQLASVDSESELEIVSGKSQSDDQRSIDYNDMSEDTLPEPGASAHYCASYEDLNGRIKKKTNNEFVFTLDCGCDMDYNRKTEQIEGNEVWCQKCRKWSSLGCFKTTINGGSGIRADHSVRVYDNEFG
eukprot:200759_1